MNKPRMLVHVCCAPDALYVLSLLKKDYEVFAYFYNPNIHPGEEYKLRLNEVRKVAQILDVNLIEEVYDAGRWLKITHKFKEEPERGRRCDVCYGLRLKRTAEKASESGYDLFATVMSLSPLKKAESLNRMGKMFSRRFGIKFLEADFKKKDGFRRSVELSKAYGLYRQNYCGCRYSKKARLARKTGKAQKKSNEKKE
jgi:predicted adenine nucleotide alpha hydrolase (AANH) superfamily ATPase